MREPQLTRVAVDMLRVASYAWIQLATMTLLKGNMKLKEGTGLPYYLTADAVVDNVMKIAPIVYQAIKRLRTDVVFENGAKEALAIGSKQLRTTGYRHRSVHPLYLNTPNFHPDTLAALAAVLHEDIQDAQRRRELYEVNSVETSLNNSLLLVGGPGSEGISRLVFGYKQLDTDVLACEGLGLDLPYRWNFNEGLPKSLRFYPRQSEPISRPNFGIIGPNRQHYYPDLGDDDFVLTDYLLLTKLPNFLADQARGSGQAIVSIAGTHGIATRAVERLLSSRSIVKRVVEDLRIDVDRAGTWPAAYQALFKVSDIKHSSRQGSRAKKMILVDAARIDESPDWWRAWKEKMREPVDSWIKNSQP